MKSNLACRQQETTALALALVLGAGLAADGCASLAPPRVPGVVASTTTITLNSRPFELHLAQPPSSVRRSALVLYASGDGGWFGMAKTMFREIANAGYPVVGISSRALLKLERPRHLDPAQLASEYTAVLAAARRALDVEVDAPVILSGWSRGAAFAVLAGDRLAASRRVAGILAIGLTDGEDLEINGSDDETDSGGAHGVAADWPFAPYDTMAQLGSSVPCAVIQATHDNYLTADRARELFGPDSASRRFYEVPARNHRFSGAHPQFVDALTRALDWMAGPAASRAVPAL